MAKKQEPERVEPQPAPRWLSLADFAANGTPDAWATTSHAAAEKAVQVALASIAQHAIAAGVIREIGAELPKQEARLAEIGKRRAELQATFDKAGERVNAVSMQYISDSAKYHDALKKAHEEREAALQAQQAYHATVDEDRCRKRVAFLRSLLDVLRSVPLPARDALPGLREWLAQV